jgi:hypothetical protein
MIWELFLTASCLLTANVMIADHCWHLKLFRLWRSQLRRHLCSFPGLIAAGHGLAVDCDVCATRPYHGGGKHLLLLCNERMTQLLDSGWWEGTLKFGWLLPVELP